mmetsp:Transcript_12618/g.33393  ORF Transcript_12618/g.33393 Transcript_12618/m.33393 type:complete len:307 (+) Transcript_12618:1754-2674(+)
MQHLLRVHADAIQGQVASGLQHKHKCLVILVASVATKYDLIQGAPAGGAADAAWRNLVGEAQIAHLPVPDRRRTPIRVAEEDLRRVCRCRHLVIALLGLLLLLLLLVLRVLALSANSLVVQGVLPLRTSVGLFDLRGGKAGAAVAAAFVLQAPHLLGRSAAVIHACRHAARRLVGCGADQMSAQQLAQVLTQGLLHGRGAGLLGQQITQVLLIRIPLECTHRLAVSIPCELIAAGFSQRGQRASMHRVWGLLLCARVVSCIEGNHTAITVHHGVALLRAKAQGASVGEAARKLLLRLPHPTMAVTL